MARSLNGTSDVIVADAANVGGMNTPFSIAAWINCSGALTNVTYYGEGRSSNNNPMIQLQVNSGKWRLILRRDSNAGTSDVNGTPVSTVTVADDTWHHVVYSQDGAGNWQLYADGTADATAHGTYTTQVQTLNTSCIGAIKRTTTSNFWAGKVAEVGSWTRQLSAGEATALAAGLPPWMLGAAHYWPLWGVDSPEPDLGTG